MVEDDTSAPPGPSLRDPAYHDLCGFFATFEEGKAWLPRAGDWLIVPPSSRPRLVTSFAAAPEQITTLPGDEDEENTFARATCVWLPTLDQLRAMVREHFGTTGFFTSTFNGSTYWYTGQMLGMTVTNMQPLAEGGSPEEAAVKALLMRHQW